MENPSDARVGQVLRSAQRIAIVGLSSKPDRPSYNIARYMLDHGYEIVPVNPNEDEVFGRPAYARLTDIPGPIDIVNVFRRKSGVPDAVLGTIAIGAPTLWLQLGVIHEDAAAAAAAAGLTVVVDRCILVEHARLVIHGAMIA